MTLADDLATLRHFAPFEARAALDRVEAEIELLTEEKNGWQEEAREFEKRLRRYDAPAPWEAQVALAEAMCERAEQRAEAAEAKVARLRDGLERIAGMSMYVPPSASHSIAQAPRVARALLAEAGAATAADGGPKWTLVWDEFEDGAAFPVVNDEQLEAMGLPTDDEIGGAA